MSFNGTGTFVINSSGQPVVSSTVISATVFNALTADLATGLSTCITKDGQTTPTNNIPMGGFKITGLGAGTVGGDAVRLSQLQAGAAQLLAVSGTDTLTALGTPTLTAYATGNLFYFVAAATNTTSVTLNVDGLGAKAVTRHGSTALVAGDILAGEVCLVVYDGTRFQLLNPASYTNLNVSGNLTLNAGTVNGVAYLNASKVVTSGSALVFDGTNLGIGSTPSAWRSGARAIQAGAAGYVSLWEQANGSTNLAFAAYESATNTFAYRTTGDAPTLYSQVTGVHTWSNAVAGTANNTFTFTERMRLDSSGNLGIGTSLPSGASGIAVVVNGGASAARFVMKNNSTGNAAGDGFQLAVSGSDAFIEQRENAALILTTNDTERMRLDSSGNLGIGTSSPTSKLVVSNAGAQGFEFDPTTGIAQTYNRSGAAYTSYKIYGLDLEFRAGASPAVAMTIDSNRNIVAGASAALATTATNGFLYVPTCAGTPTGTPTAITGMAPIVVNTTNNKLYFYSGGAWRDAGP